ncbi:MAG: YesL family protein [Oscillospiraceae bacterium]|nr:YesL family protein [Oscillospiraceae bacterium]
MKRRFFNAESGLWKPLGVLGDLLMLSLLWGVCCLPVLTIGAATTALYDTVVHVLRRQDDVLFARFFGTLRRELATGALSTVLWIAVISAEYLLYRFLMTSLPEDSRSVVLIAYLVLVPFFTFCVLGWVFPILSRFTFRAMALNVTAVRLAFGNILRSAVLGIIAEANFFLALAVGPALMVTPALAALLASYVIEPVFEKYEHPEGEREAEKP